MKIFTVDLEDKNSMKNAATEVNTETGAIATPSFLPASPSFIAVEKKYRPFKAYLMCITTLFFVALLAIIFTEIAYNRIRDENFLRLQWIELKNRLGYREVCEECLNARLIANSLYQQNRLEPISPTPIVETTTGIVRESRGKFSDDSTQTKKDERDDGPLGFMRDIMKRVREEVEENGFNGNMQISIYKMKPNAEDKTRSFLDGFGEVKQPSFGERINSKPVFSIFPLTDEIFENERAEDSKWKPEIEIMEPNEQPDDIESMINSVLGMLRNIDNNVFPIPIVQQQQQQQQQPENLLDIPKFDSPADKSSVFIFPIDSLPGFGDRLNIRPSPFDRPMHEMKNPIWDGPRDFWPEAKNEPWNNNFLKTVFDSGFPMEPAGIPTWIQPNSNEKLDDKLNLVDEPQIPTVPVIIDDGPFRPALNIERIPSLNPDLGSSEEHFIDKQKEIDPQSVVDDKNHMLLFGNKFDPSEMIFTNGDQ